MEKKQIMLVATGDHEKEYRKLSTFIEEGKVGDMLNCLEADLDVYEITPLRIERQHYHVDGIFKYYHGYLFILDTDFGFKADAVPFLPLEVDVMEKRRVWQFLADNQAQTGRYAALQWEAYDADSFDDWSLSPDMLSKLRALLDCEIRSLYFDYDEENNVYIDFIGAKANSIDDYNVSAMFWVGEYIVAIMGVPETDGIIYPVILNPKLNIN